MENQKTARPSVPSAFFSGPLGIVSYSAVRIFGFQTFSPKRFVIIRLLAARRRCGASCWGVFVSAQSVLLSKTCRQNVLIGVLIAVDGVGRRFRKSSRQMILGTQQPQLLFAASRGPFS